MKKFYIALLAACGLSIGATAQQLPNSGFEDNWVDCIPWTSTNNTNAVGSTPSPWTIANVKTSGDPKVGESVQGRNSSKAVKLSNYNISINLGFININQTVPGYFSLGKAWSTSKGAKAENKDGGTFGGLEFSFKPDAISFWYKSTGSEQPNVLFYSWKGTWTQSEVPGNIAITGSPKTATMIDRDRNILDIQTDQGGKITSTPDAKRISYLNARMNASTDDWAQAKFEIPYSSTTDQPEKTNVIFSAGEYLSTSPVKDNTLTVDDIQLIYFSRLKSLKVNGENVDGFDPNTYEYNLDAAMPESADAIEATCLGNSGSGKAEVALDPENKKATITVTNSNESGLDEDGEAFHVYILNFVNKATVVETVTFTGDLFVDLSEIDMGAMNLDDTPVYLMTMDNGTYTLLLKNFGATEDNPEGMGSIEFGNLTLDGTKLSGTKDDISLLGGFIQASGTLDGTLDGNKISLKLDILWSDGNDELPIYVTFVNVVDTDKWNGKLSIATGNAAAEETDQAPLWVKQMGDDTYTLHFIVKEETEQGVSTFAAEDAAQEIKVRGVKIDKSGNVSGSVERVEMLDGKLVSLSVSGTLTDSKADLKLEGNWHENDTQDTPLNITYFSEKNTSGIEDIEAEDADAPAEYFNIRGMKVPADALTPGFYIVRQGKKVSKVIVK